MKRTRVISASIGFLAGLIVACSAFIVCQKDKALVEAKTSWFVCTRVNMDVISDAVANYVRTNPMPDSMDLETLVRARQLPEWSDIYICPAQYGIAPVRTNYDDSFRSNLFKPSPVAASYSNCSYYIETLSNSFRVRCRFHTNELNFAVSKNTSKKAKH